MSADVATEREDGVEVDLDDLWEWGESVSSQLPVKGWRMRVAWRRRIESKGA